MSTSLDWALTYIGRGWKPVPIATRTKAPKISNWPALRIKEADAPRFFARVCNIGIILGEASNGLVDLDLDCPEANELAPKHLPRTSTRFGRASKPSSHWLYHIEGSAPTIKLKDPLTDEMLVELRGDGGQQTVFPGSIHESGERIEWAENGEPATAEYLELCQAAKRLAAACLIRRYLPEAKDQDRFNLALSTCEPKLANCLRDWLKIGRPSEVPRHDDRDVFGLKGPPPAYMLRNTGRSLKERLFALFAEGASERPTFGSEPIAEGCAQIRELRDNAANQGRDSWWPCLGVLAFCEDGDQSAHVWGAAHPKYSAEETQRELDGWRQKADGATLCETFDRKSPGICGKCPHRGALRSPISLGMRWPEPMLAQDAPSLVPVEIKTQSAGMFSPPLAIEAPSERIVSGDELLATAAPPRRWLVDKFVPTAETTNLGGDGGTGKTTLALQLSVACVSGGNWIGLKVNLCNVLYVSAEDPTDEIHFRFEQITKDARLPAEQLARFKLIDLAGKDATIATFAHGLIKQTPLFDRIVSLAREHRAACIIFDSVADFFGGNENERREVRAFVGLLRGLAMRLDAAVIFLAHPSVDGIKTGRGYSGSTHWNNAVRSRLYFTDAAEDGQPPNPDLRMIELAKSNRARRGEKIYVVWRDGRFVETSAAAAAVVNSKNEADNEELFLQLLSKLDRQGMNVSPHRSSTYAPTAMAKMPASNGVGKPALERAMHQLLDKGKIRVEENGPPSKRRHRLVAVAGSRSNGVAYADHTTPAVGEPEEPGPPTRGGLGAPGGYGGLEGTPVGRASGGSSAGES